VPGPLRCTRASLLDHLCHLAFQSHKLPFQDDNLLVQDMVPSLEPLGLDLLSQMLRYEPQKRITARAAVKHPYFSDVAQMFAQRILVA